MIETVRAIAREQDDKSLEELWTLLGGDTPIGNVGRSRDQQADLLIELIRSACLGKGEIYSAERAALAELAATFNVETSRFPTAEALEDAIVDAMADQLSARLQRMSDNDRRQFVENMIRRMPDEDRIRLVDRVLGDFDQLGPDEQEAFVKQLGAELDVDLAAMRGAIAGGAATLLPLLIAKQSGFSVFLLTTRVMFVVSSKAGATLPFAVYMLKNRALGWLLGPVGMLVTTGLSVGWFAAKTWRRRERFRKMMQLVAYTTAWRREQQLAQRGVLG